jgi:hypothetical protein
MSPHPLLKLNSIRIPTNATTVGAFIALAGFSTACLSPLREVTLSSGKGTKAAPGRIDLAPLNPQGDLTADSAGFLLRLADVDGRSSSRTGDSVRVFRYRGPDCRDDEEVWAGPRPASAGWVEFASVAVPPLADRSVISYRAVSESGARSPCVPLTVRKQLAAGRVLLDVRASDPDWRQKIPEFERVETDPETGQPAFTETRASRMTPSLPSFPIDPNKTYTARFEVKSTGHEPSRIFAGFMALRADDQHIDSWFANRRAHPVRVERIDAGSRVLHTRDPLEEWNSWSVEGAAEKNENGLFYMRLIGIYLDGDLSKEPDHVILGPQAPWGSPDEYAAGFGAYSTAVDRQIRLNALPPKEILDRIGEKTIVMQHFASSTYIYNAAHSQDVPSDWTVYEGRIRGAAFTSMHSFRPGTQAAKVQLIPNYLQDEPGAAKLWVRRVTLTEH